MKIKISRCKIKELRHNFNRLTLKQLRIKSKSVNLKSGSIQLGHSFLFLKNNWLYILFAVLFIADGIITNLIINTGIGSEGNPLVAHLAGTNWLIILKLLGAFVAIYCLIRLRQKHPRVERYSTISCIAVYSFVLIGNLGVYFK